MFKVSCFGNELIHFAHKEARVCLAPALFILMLEVSRLIPGQGIARYDFIFLAACVSR